MQARFAGLQYNRLMEQALRASTNLQLCGKKLRPSNLAVALFFRT
jgi:hypothetical protein